MWLEEISTIIQDVFYENIDNCSRVISCTPSLKYNQNINENINANNLGTHNELPTLSSEKKVYINLPDGACEHVVDNSEIVKQASVHASPPTINRCSLT